MDSKQKPQTTLADNDLNEQQAVVLAAANHNLSLVIDQLQTIDLPKLDGIVDTLDNAKEKLDKFNG